MRLSTEHHLFLTYLGLIAALTLVLSFGVDALLRRELRAALEADLRRELVLGAELYDRSDGLSTDSVVRRIGDAPDRRITLVDPRGRVLADWPDVDARETALDDFRVRPEIQAAFDTGSGRAVRLDPRLGRELVYLAIETRRGDVLRVGRSFAPVEAALAAVQRGIFGAAALGVVLAALFTVGFGVAVVRPLGRITDAARALAGGHFSERVRLRRDDELGELASALNRLADELQRRLGQLEGERAEMQALIDSMSEGVLAISPARALRRANPAARRMFALPADPVGISPEVISRRPDFLSLVSEALAGETVPPRELAGGGVTLLATAHPLPDGGAVLVLLDVTELRRLEGVRRDFVANASHELKTPLTAIRGYSETLAEPDLPPDLVRRFAGVVKANADRLQRIVDDLLDLSRIEAGGWRIDPTRLSLEDVARDAWPATGAADHAVELRFELEEGRETVWADGGAVRQILANLFDNALRYTPPRGTVTVRGRAPSPVEARRRPGARPEDGVDWTVVEVQDTGSGIPSAHVARVFERFYRVDPGRSRDEGGTGLGLSIVKHLVESHGGWIEADSHVGAGTTIRFTLPAHPPAADAGPAEG